MKAKKHNIEIDSRKYDLIVGENRISSHPESVKMIIPAYQPNKIASNILRTCIHAIQRFTHCPYELWIVDNNSPTANSHWLLEWPDINVILSQTEPLPSEARSLWHKYFCKRLQTHWGSYANAVGLEIGLRLINSCSKYVMTLHMDTMPAHPDWLSYLKSKLNERDRAVGVCRETMRITEGVLHVLGMLFDYSLFQKLELDFFPDLPEMDVGDRISIDFKRNGYSFFSCRNTYENPELNEHIPTESVFKNKGIVRVFDDKMNVIFLHLGRGIPKAENRYAGKASSAAEWFEIAKAIL